MLLKESVMVSKSINAHKCNSECQCPFVWILIWILLLTQTLNTHMPVESRNEGASLLKMTNNSSMSLYQYPMKTVETSTHGSNLFQYRRFISPDVEKKSSANEWGVCNREVANRVRCAMLFLYCCLPVLMFWWSSKQKLSMPLPRVYPQNSQYLKN